jgi:hypothetical protein
MPENEEENTEEEAWDEEVVLRITQGNILLANINNELHTIRKWLLFIGQALALLIFGYAIGSLLGMMVTK